MEPRLQAILKAIFENLFWVIKRNYQLVGFSFSQEREKRRERQNAFSLESGQNWNRTSDTRIFSLEKPFLQITFDYLKLLKIAKV
jgi:hypothetical protein